MITIEGERDGKLGYLWAKVKCKDPSIDRNIRFAVDTGASKTTLSESAVYILGLKYASLEKSDRVLKGIGGKAECYLIKDVTLEFELKDGSWYSIPLEEMGVMKCMIEDVECPKCEHVWKYKEKEISDHAMEIPSLLGIDILERFSIRITPRHIYLEK